MMGEFRMLMHLPRAYQIPMTLLIITNYVAVAVAAAATPCQLWTTTIHSISTKNATSEIYSIYIYLP